MSISLMFAAMALVLSSANMAEELQAAEPAWQVDWGTRYCTMIRLPDRDVPFVTAVRQVPGMAGASILVSQTSSATAELPRNITGVRLLPSRATIDVRPRLERRRSGSVLVLRGLREDFVRSLGDSTELLLLEGDAISQRVPLSSAAAAVGNFQHCVSTRMEEWGLDETSLAALRELPVMTTLGLTHEDYPASAVAAGRQGEVVVRLDLNSEGRPTACEVVVSSGHRDLDAATCRGIRARGRYRPAINAAGEAVPVRITSLFSWTIHVQ